MNTLSFGKTSSFKPFKSLFLLCTFISVLLTGHADASQTIQTRMIKNSLYLTELHAVTAMARLFLVDSVKNDVEHMGAILVTPGGKYQVTHGRSVPGKDAFRFSVLRPVSLKVVAYWHTHGAHGSARGKFSASDSQTVQNTGLPFYLITPQGEIRVLQEMSEHNSNQFLSPGSRSGIFVAKI